MKSIILTPKRLKRELLFWLVSFGIAITLNIYSIVKYKTNWNEMITQMGYVFLISLLIYFLIFLIRVIISMVKSKQK
jgi:hypothetical protein